MKPLKFLLVFSITMADVQLNASPPSWVVNSSEYEYSMSFSGVAMIDGVECRDTADRVAAWVNGELRGMARPFYLDGTDRYYFLTTVYSNLLSQPESITFTFYDASRDTIIGLINEEEFVADENSGTFSDPYWYINEGLVTENDPLDVEAAMVYPNPFSDHLSFRGFESNISVQVYDVNGRRVLHHTEISTVNTAHLDPGVYLICISFEGVEQLLKLVKQ